MFILMNIGPSLRCSLSRIYPYHSAWRRFIIVVPKKLHYPNFDPIHTKVVQTSADITQQQLLTNHVIKRFRYRKQQDEDSSDSEDEVETVEDDGKDFKLLRLKVNSLRADLILKAALGMARNKVETAFFQSKIRVNGELVAKKSVQVKPNDEIDLVRGISKMNPRFLNVSRVKVISYTQSNEKCVVNAQCFRALTIENYEDRPWKPSE